MQEEAVFGGGCFWCTESVFQAIKGVLRVTSGYAGGARANPTYEEVCSGQTGHVEVVKVVYDRSQISYRTLLEIFFATHDPTTRNRQGNDVGSQYRSVIFVQNEEQRLIAQTVIEGLNGAKVYPAPIVTEVESASPFYEAESYHQNYFQRNPYQPYCVYSIPPKLEKLEKYLASKPELLR